MKSTELFDRYIDSCTPEEREQALDVVEKVEFICKLRGIPKFGPDSAIDLVVCLVRWMAMIDNRKAQRK